MSVLTRPTPRAGDLARDRRRRVTRGTGVMIGLAAAGFLTFCVSLALGEVDLGLPNVVGALFGFADGGAGYIVTELRLPRALVAVLAGAAFGMSGAIFQSLVRNPLASPDLIGITAGASAAAVLALLLFGLDGAAVSAAAFVGALATALAIYVLAWRKGISGYRLVLVGVAMGAMLTSVVSFALTRAEVYDARNALGWLTGSLNAKTWDTVQVLAPSLAVLVPLALLAGRRLRPLQLGDDMAQALGVPVERARLSLIVVAVALAAVATAAVGPVVFVAFVSGPIAHRMVGGPGPALAPAALVGALVITASDIVAQNAFGSVQFPVGVVTAVLGAPYLLWLLAVTNRVGRGG